MQYFTDSNRPKVKAQKVGSKIEPIYKERFDKNGNKVLKIVGQTNVFERSQSDKDLCDINKTVEKYGITIADSVRRLMANNDIEFFDEVYQDMSIFDRQNKMIELEEQFNGLDAKVKAHFGNSFSKFYNAVADGSIVSNLEKIDNKTVRSVQVEKSAAINPGTIVPGSAVPETIIQGGSTNG